jgi:hypothetical protein
VATLKQYEFFRSLYDEETDRQKQLHDMAKGYLSLATLYSAFVVFVVKELPMQSLVTKGAFFGSIICMISAFLLSLWATKVSDYEAVNEPQDVVDEFGDEPMPDEEFFDNRIADYTVACERNSAVNDKKASWLTVAAYVLVVGILLQAVYILSRSS